MSSALDEAIARLAEGSALWSGLTLDQRARLLDRTHASAGAVAAEWAETAARIKGLDPGHPTAGEEWLTGPYAFLTALDAVAASLRALAAGRSPAGRLRSRTTRGGRTVFDVFPRTRREHLLLMGFTGEVWLRPGVSASAAKAAAGLAQRTPGRPGGIGLVLGAGNVTSIPVLDVLSELVSANRVSLLKLNPTMDPLLPVFERALAPLVELGLVRIVTGGPAEGAALTRHPRIEHVHVTGSGATFDAIVWGTGKDAAGRRAADRPALTTPITAELGGVSPVIVVPGPWRDADLRFQAQHIATMRLNNSGHNCVAGQVVVVSADWDRRDAFLAELRAAYRRAPERPVWYPRADERIADARAAHPDTALAPDRLLVPLAGDDDVETVEYFAPVLGVRELPGLGRAFLDAAVDYANDRLAGTLGADVLIDPDTERELGDGFEDAIERLRYGSIAINTWTGTAFVTPTLPWGAFPGGTLEEVGSGIGTVHNAYLFDDVERGVLRGPFRPFPRNLTGGRMTLLPTPPWFVGARTANTVSEGLTRNLVDGDPIRLAATLAAAYRA
ncbi:aldehyde dehydrogenase family protein [Microbacterium sp. X-17]|uniref:aldehyde dehydrogenase family protein n=1 Tax=Microbacterium sp. X-17 TaxID=3144404 RepID=UPI0031F5924D